MPVSDDGKTTRSERRPDGVTEKNGDLIENTKGKNLKYLQYYKNGHNMTNTDAKDGEEKENNVPQDKMADVMEDHMKGQMSGTYIGKHITMTNGTDSIEMLSADLKELNINTTEPVPQTDTRGQRRVEVPYTSGRKEPVESSDVKSSSDDEDMSSEVITNIRAVPIITDTPAPSVGKHSDQQRDKEDDDDDNDDDYNDDKNDEHMVSIEKTSGESSLGKRGPPGVPKYNEQQQRLLQTCMYAAQPQYHAQGFQPMPVNNQGKRRHDDEDLMPTKGFHGDLNVFDPTKLSTFPLQGIVQNQRNIVEPRMLSGGNMTENSLPMTASFDSLELADNLWKTIVENENNTGKPFGEGNPPAVSAQVNVNHPQNQGVPQAFPQPHQEIPQAVLPKVQQMQQSFHPSSPSSGYGSPERDPYSPKSEIHSPKSHSSGYTSSPEHYPQYTQECKTQYPQEHQKPFPQGMRSQFTTQDPAIYPVGQQMQYHPKQQTQFSPERYSQYPSKGNTVYIKNETRPISSPPHRVQVSEQNKYGPTPSPPAREQCQQTQQHDIKVTQPVYPGQGHIYQGQVPGSRSPPSALAATSHMALSATSPQRADDIPACFQVNLEPPTSCAMRTDNYQMAGLIMKQTLPVSAVRQNPCQQEFSAPPCNQPNVYEEPFIPLDFEPDLFVQNGPPECDQCEEKVAASQLSDEKREEYFNFAEELIAKDAHVNGQVSAPQQLERPITAPNRVVQNPVLKVHSSRATPLEPPLQMSQADYSKVPYNTDPVQVTRQQPVTIVTTPGQSVTMQLPCTSSQAFVLPAQPHNIVKSSTCGGKYPPILPKPAATIGTGIDVAVNPVIPQQAPLCQPPVPTTCVNSSQPQQVPPPMFPTEYATATDHRTVTEFGSNEFLKTDSDGDTCLHVMAAEDELQLGLFEAILCRLMRENRLHEILNKQNNDSQTPIYMAVLMNRHLLVDILVKFGADPNTQARRSVVVDSDTTRIASKGPLHHACSHGVQFLPTLRALLTSPILDKNDRDSSGLTPIQCAAKAHRKPTRTKGMVLDSKDIIMTMVQAGADLSKPDGLSGKNGFHYIIETQDLELIEAVIETVHNNRNGMPLSELLNKQTNDGLTALHIAAGLWMTNTKQHLKMLRMLMMKGANATARNHEKKLPREVVPRALPGYQEIIDVLTGSTKSRPR